MKLRRHYVLVCQNRRPDGHPRGCCADSGSNEVLQRFKRLIEEKKIREDVRAIGTTCLDLCEHGVVLAVFPDNVWYGQVGPEDVEAVVEEHLIGGTPVRRLRLPRE